MDLKERVRIAEARLREAVEARERGNSELNEMWSRVRDRFVEKDGELAGFRDRVVLKEGELNEIRERMAQQEALIEELQERLAKQDVELTGLRERVANQDAQLKQSQTSLSEKQEENVEFQTRIAKQSKDIAQNEAQIATLTEQNKELSDSLEALLASVEGRVSVLTDGSVDGEIESQMRGLVDKPSAAEAPSGPAPAAPAQKAPPAPAPDIEPPAATMPDLEPVPEPAVEAMPEPEPLVDEMPEPEPEPLVDEMPEPEPEPLVDEMPEPEPEPVVPEIATTPDDPTEEMSVGDIVATVQASQENVTDMGNQLQTALERLGVDQEECRAVAGAIELVPPPPPPLLPEPLPADIEVIEEGSDSESGLRKLMSRLGGSAKFDAEKQKKKRAIGRPKLKEEPPVEPAPENENIAPLTEAGAPEAEETSVPDLKLEEPVSAAEEPDEAISEPEQEQEQEQEPAPIPEPEAEAVPEVQISAMPGDDASLAEELEEIESLRVGLTGLRDKLTG